MSVGPSDAVPRSVQVAAAWSWRLLAILLALAAVVLADEAFGLKLKGPVQALIWITAGLTVASLVAYLRVWLRHMTLYESTGSKS